MKNEEYKSKHHKRDNLIGFIVTMIFCALPFSALLFI